MGGWPRIAGLRVVMSWPDSEFAPQPPPRGRGRVRLAGLAGGSLVFGGAVAILVALLTQQHAPSPAASAAGRVGPDGAKEQALHQSPPVAVSIPAIGVKSKLLHLGLNKDGTIQVPDLNTSANEAAWYKYSATPGQIGTSVIEGHVDSYGGPAVFYRLGALSPGNRVSVTLARTAGFWELDLPASRSAPVTAARLLPRAAWRLALRLLPALVPPLVI